MPLTKASGVPMTVALQVVPMQRVANAARASRDGADAGTPRPRCRWELPLMKEWVLNDLSHLTLAIGRFSIGVDCWRARSRMAYSGLALRPDRVRTFFWCLQC